MLEYGTVKQTTTLIQIYYIFIGALSLLQILALFAIAICTTIIHMKLNKYANLVLKHLYYFIEFLCVILAVLNLSIVKNSILKQKIIFNN